MDEHTDQEHTLMCRSKVSISLDSVLERKSHTNMAISSGGRLSCLCFWLHSYYCFLLVSLLLPRWCACLSLVKLDSPTIGTHASSNAAWLLNPSMIRRPLLLHEHYQPYRQNQLLQHQHLPVIPTESSVQISQSSSPHMNLYRDQYSVQWTAAQNGLTTTTGEPTYDHTDQPTMKSATLADVNYPDKGSNRYVPVISTRIVSKREQTNPAADSNRFMPESGHHHQPHLDTFDLDTFLKSSLGQQGQVETNRGNNQVYPQQSIRVSGDDDEQRDLENVFKMDDLNMFNLDLF